jgi:hypothetical protein
MAILLKESRNLIGPREPEGLYTENRKNKQLFKHHEDWQNFSLIKTEDDVDPDKGDPNKFLWNFSEVPKTELVLYINMPYQSNDIAKFFK